MPATATFGDIARTYEDGLVPLLFVPYAEDLALRALALGGDRVLETACGTGAATRRLDAVLPAGVEIVATDLSETMLDEAQAQLAPRPGRLSYRQADAADLPFAPGSFDTVVCQFGAMFLPDKPAGFREMRRVLRPGGTLLFNVWERLSANPVWHIAETTVREMYGSAGPDFVPKPFHYHSVARIRADLRAAGFRKISVEHVGAETCGESAFDVATAVVRGTPLFDQVEASGIDPSEVVARLAARLAQRLGEAPCRNPMSAIVVSARR